MLLAVFSAQILVRNPKDDLVRLLLIGDTHGKLGAIDELAARAWADAARFTAPGIDIGYFCSAVVEPAYHFMKALGLRLAELSGTLILFSFKVRNLAP